MGCAYTLPSMLLFPLFDDAATTEMCSVDLRDGLPVCRASRLGASSTKVRSVELRNITYSRTQLKNHILNESAKRGASQ